MDEGSGYCGSGSEIESVSDAAKIVATGMSNLQITLIDGEISFDTYHGSTVSIIW